ncbi:MAG: NAD(P)/FAD-dependent oxidoreductase [Candidatus Binatia bacterium]
MERFDVAIIGAGPAGAAAAISLARKGHKVALIDKEKFPREKLCGDFINPLNWPILRELGMEDDILATEHEKVTAFRITACSGEEAEARLPSRKEQADFGLGLRRWSLDYALLRKAERAGVAVFQGGKVKELKRRSQGWSAAMNHSATIAELRADILIAADGRNSWLAHRLGLTGAAEMQGRSVGFQLRLQVRDVTHGRVEIHLFPGGYAGVVGLGDGTVNLCLAVEKEKLPHQRQMEFLWNSCLPHNPYLKELLRRSVRVGEAHSTYPVYFKPRRCFADGVLLVGDAARVSEPVSGEGMYFAMKSGLLAAETVGEAFCSGDFSTAHLSRYERECRHAFRFRSGINSLIRLLVYRPRLLAPLVRFSAKQGRLLDTLVHAICTPQPAR